MNLKERIKYICSNTIFVKLFLWWIIILFLEISFSLTISNNINLQLLVNVFLISIILSLLFTFITSLFNEKINTIITSIILLVLGLLFSTQAVFYKIFKVYFSIYDLALQDQLNSFVKETVILILKNSPYILLFMLPLIIYIIFHKKLPNKQLSKETNFIIFLLVLSFTLIRQSFIEFNKDKSFSTYDLIHNVNNVSLSIKKLGVLNSYYIELNRVIFGYKITKIKHVSIDEEDDEKEIVYEPNILDLKLEDTDDPNVNTINAYFREDKPTLKNEYTGIFKDYNLVYITAESFSEIGVRKDLTPTLYKLVNNGFVFKNFYTPNNLSTIGGEMQSLTGLYPDYSILKTWRDGTNIFPYGIANTFKNMGYNTYAYHNNAYNFQDRDKYIASQGFTNFLACYNGLENRMNCETWPQSDLDMIDSTLDDYINSEKPFLAYYMTVSGHFEYNFDDNAMAYKNMSLVDYLNMSEEAKAYLATQIELDRALEKLINELDKKGKLDKTVFVLMADHYPYELAESAINELSDYDRNEIEINHNALIIWNNKLETKEIEKPCMSPDVLPTVYNLFGVDYDSRMFTGRDILSTSSGIAVLVDRSWISDYGLYNASTNTFAPKKEVEEGYVDKVNQLVNNRLNIARLIIATDYYKYVK